MTNSMRPRLALLSVFLLIGCEDFQQDTEAALITSKFPAIVAPLLDPAKLDSLKGKRAATPRLRKTCYWLEMAKREGNDLGTVIDQAHALTAPHKPERLKAQKGFPDSQRHDPGASGVPR
jgi:hypothetical protein